MPRDKAEAAEAVWRAMYDAAPAMEKPADRAATAELQHEKWQADIEFKRAEKAEAEVAAAEKYAAVR